MEIDYSSLKHKIVKNTSNLGSAWAATGPTVH